MNGLRLQRRVSPSAAVGLASALGMWLWIALESRAMLAVDVAVWGDSAANAILVDRALGGRQLVGYYSRFGFSHPGPAFIYVEAAGELFFRRWLPISVSSFGAGALAVAALNSALVGWCVAIVVKRSRSIAAGLVLCLCTILVTTWVPSQFSNAWAPSLVLVPFMLMLIAGIAVAAGHFEHLTALAVSACLLLHGHVSMGPYVAVTALVVVAATLRRRSSDPAFELPERRDWVPAAAVTALFASPIVLHTVLNWPGELRAYMATGRGSASRIQSTPLDATGFWVESLAGSPAQLGMIAASLCALGVLALARRLGPEVRLAIWMLVAQMLMLWLYSWRVVDDVEFKYLGWFAAGIPVVAVTVATSAALIEVDRRLGRSAKRVAGGVIVVGLLIPALGWARLGQGAPSSPVVAELARAAGTDPIRIDFEHDDWPIAVGVLVELNRHGGSACLIDPTWEFMVTSDMICEGRVGRRVRVSSAAADQQDPAVLGRSGEYVVLTEP